MNLKFFWPDRTAKSVFDVDFEAEYERGIRGLIFDIDNTLVAHGKEATPEVVALIRSLKERGFSTCLISNNGEERVRPFAEAVGSMYLPDAGKPALRSYTRAMAEMHTDIGNTLFLGDQILTDIWGAKRLGMQHILVHPVDRKKDPFFVRVKRRLERFILRNYKQKKERLEKPGGMV